MDEQREKLLRWLTGVLGSKKELTAEENANYLELERILKLAPPTLTYNISKFVDETEELRINNPYMPIYADWGDGPYSIVGWHRASLDGGGQGPDEDAIVLEVE